MWTPGPFDFSSMPDFLAVRPDMMRVPLAGTLARARALPAKAGASGGLLSHRCPPAREETAAEWNQYIAGVAGTRNCCIASHSDRQEMGTEGRGYMFIFAYLRAAECFLSSRPQSTVGMVVSPRVHNSYRWSANTVFSREILVWSQSFLKVVTKAVTKVESSNGRVR